METVLAIFADIDDPRDHTAQYELAALLFISLAATLCGARSCVDIADLAAANQADLAEFVDLPVDATPSHDTFSRMFRLLDPPQLEDAFQGMRITRSCGQASESQPVRPVNLRLRLASPRCEAVFGRVLNVFPDRHLDV